jgi:hypothetical protein
MINWWGKMKEELSAGDDIVRPCDRGSQDFDPGNESDGMTGWKTFPGKIRFFPGI